MSMKKDRKNKEFTWLKGATPMEIRLLNAAENIAARKAQLFSLKPIIFKAQR